MRGKFSAGHDKSKLSVMLNEQTNTIEIPKTDGWFDVQAINIGTYAFNEAGVYHLILQPTSTEEWRAVDVFGIELAPVKAE